MSESAPYVPNPELDLVLERVVPVPAERVWRAWTIPEQLMQWFTPRPWQTIDCEIDLRPGGIFRTVMRSPEGEEMDAGAGCYLEVVTNRRLVWTSALGPGYRPNVIAPEALVFTASIDLLPQPGGETRYIATAMHPDPASAARHEEMGFHHGWGAALDQLIELVRST